MIDIQSYKIHQLALIFTLIVLASLLSWIRGWLVSDLWVMLASLVLVGVLGIWCLNTVYDFKSQVNRHGLILGCFGVAMFAFSYAMVPLYHIVCHAGGKREAVESSTYHPLELDIFVQAYRSLPVKVKASVRHLQLNTHNSEVVMIDLKNESNKSLDIRLTTTSQPRTLKPAFGLVYPTDIHLEPKRHIRFPVEIKMNEAISDDLWQSALLFLFQDVNGVGQLGQGDSWKKMQNIGYVEGVEYES